MKSKFRGYYPPSDDELEKIWAGGLIVLDTNALLNILRYSAATRDQLLDLLVREKDRIWIPYQVGLEFHRNRRTTPTDVMNAFSSVDIALDKARKEIKSAVEGLRRHARLEADELGVSLERRAKKLSKELRRARRKHDAAVTSDQAHTETFNRISELYDGRVGEPYGVDALKALYKEGAERYAKQIPPGFRDAAIKDDDRKYGDFILWRQILDHAAVEKRPLLFITDDNKDDWWERHGGSTFGPRPELIEEYYTASGERAHFYNLRRFLEFAKTRGANISDASVKEAEKVSSIADPKWTAARRNALERALEQAAGIAHSNIFEGIAEKNRLISDHLAMPISNAQRIVEAVQLLAESQSPQLAEYNRAYNNLVLGSIDTSRFVSNIALSENYLKGQSVLQAMLKNLAEERDREVRRELIHGDESPDFETEDVLNAENESDQT